MIGVFAATDVFLFYVFFEAMLIPMYFMIGSYGGPQRSYAAVKFLLYSLFGGLLMLVAVIGLYVVSPTRERHVPVHRADRRTSTRPRSKWLFLGFFIAFAIKAPLVPFHTWLPDAAAQAPPAPRCCSSACSTRSARSACCASAWSCSRTRPVVHAAGDRAAVIGIVYGAIAGDRPDRHQAPDRLHVGLALRLHRAGRVRDDHAGPGRRDALHGQPRLLDRRAVPRRRLPDHPPRLGVDRRLRRRAEGRAGAGRTFLVAGLSGLSLPGLSHVRVASSLVLVGTFTAATTVPAIIATRRHHPGRDLHPVDVPAHDDRADRPRP